MRARWLAALLLAAPVLADSGSNIVNIDMSNYEQVLAESGPLLIYFYNKKCTDCRDTAPIVKDMAAEYAGKVRFGVTHIFGPGEKDHWSAHWSGISADKGPVNSVPTFVFVQDGAEKHRASASLNGDDTEKKQKSLKCLIDLVLLKQKKEESTNCSN